LSGGDDQTYGTGVIYLRSGFDFAAYRAGSNDDKRRLLVELLNTVCLYTARTRAWDLAPFDAAYKEALNRKCKLEEFGRRTWLSPDRKHRARVSYVCDIDCTWLTCVLTKSNSRAEIARKPLGKALPGAYALQAALGEGEWISRSTFELRDEAYSQGRWRADFSDVMGTSGSE
jgi:hypothetical protein